MAKKKEFGVSFGQKSLWFHQQRNPDSFRYNLTFVAKVISELDIGKLRFSIQQLVIKYETLRTQYHNNGNVLVQSVNKEFIPEFLISDATQWSLNDIKLEIEREAQRPFDLSQGQLLRARIFLRTAADPIFLLSTHHIAVDLWSMVHLVQDLGFAYSNKNILDCNRESINNYQNYVTYQTKEFRSESLSKQEIFWNTYLTGNLPIVSLTTDFPRPAKKREHSEIKRFYINKTISEQLRKFSLKHGVTLYTTLLTSYFLLLYKYTRQADLMVSSPFSGRKNSEFRKTFGFFVNPVIIRTTINDNINCIDLLKEINCNVASVFANQDFPYSLLIEKKSTIYDPSRSPLCDIEFVYDRPIKIPKVAPFILGEAGEILDLGDLVLESFEMNKRCTEKDLQLFITDDKEKLYCGFQYAKDLFEASTIENMAQQYSDILCGLMASPHEKIKKIQFFNQTNVQRITSTHSSLEIPENIILLDLFENQIKQNPDAIAIYHGEKRFSFNEINCFANSLATALVDRGVVRGDIVALCLPRSACAIISILAIHKAGAIYLPLDDEAPKSRIKVILDDSKSKILIVNDENTGLAYKEQCEFINIASLTSFQPSGEQQDFTRVSITPNDIAYLIYTSGSTGKPKGVMVQHHSMMNLLYALTSSIEIYQSGQPLKVGVNAPIFFDSSIKQIIMLFAGHSLDIIPNEIRINAKDFITYINVHQLDVFDITPSQIEILIAEGLFSNHPQSNKTILIGGEKIALSLWQRLLNAKGFDSYNVYGPTECTVDATIARIDKNINPLPILGKSLPNMQIYLLDNNLNQVAIGMPGEIYIGGRGVSNGYFNNPKLTASKFIPDPYTNLLGGRLYKTGDLARYRLNGTIEFLGRIDAQIKLRGYRIELGEIESLLIKYADVRQCVVIAHETPGESSRIIAYIVPVQANTLSVAAIKSYLAQYLPAYMCPAQYIIMNSLPMTANGKLDYKNLPISKNTSFDKKSEDFKPSSPLEIWLKDVWQKLLNVEPGTNDSFFELGGHSLLVMQLIARIQDQYKVRISISELFDHPTITEIAKLIELNRNKNTHSIYEFEPTTNRPTIFHASYQQKRLWFLDQLTPNNPVYNISGAAEFLGPFDFEIFLKSLMLMEKNHEVLRTTFYENEEDIFQSVVNSDIAQRSQFIDLSQKTEKSKTELVKTQIVKETQKPFHLKDGCLWRVLVLKLNINKHLVVLTMHHIISDGWSNKIFLQELLDHYEKFLCGHNNFSTHPPFQYIDYTNWQRQWFESKEMQQQFIYWQNKLKDAPAYLNIPTDNPHNATQRYHGASCTFTISSSIKEKLQILSQNESATLFMTLVSILKLLLFRYSNQDDVLIGTPIAGRRSREMENMLGLFANTVVLRSQNLRSLSFQELLNQVKKSTIEAFDNQDCPFEHIVELVKPERDLSRSPLFQVMFVFENTDMTKLSSHVMDIAMLPLPRTTAKFDLTFEIKNQEQLSGVVEYNTDIFKSDTIERMIGHYLHLMDEVTKNPCLALDQYKLMSTKECQRVKQLWRHSQEFKVSKNILIHLFEATVARSPEKTALVTKTSKLSYDNLNQKANQLASYLLMIGLKQKDVIGIFLPRQEEMIVAILAVLKIGGVYLPLDPTYPSMRTHTVLKTAQATHIISITHLKPHLATDLKIETICLDEHSDMITKSSSKNLNLPIHTNDNLYIIYTSGSTGTPKGVVINNLNVTNFIEWAHTVFGQDFSAVLASTSICFDLSVFEIFGTLTFGGKLYLVENALALIENQDAYPVTLINTVPSVVKELLLAKAIPATVTTINLAGEPLMNHLAQEIYLNTSISYLYNLYGPSETTTYSTYTLIPRDSSLTACHIGKPIANTYVYVLDELLNPLPVGIPGEIYIGGLGVAQGYWQNQNLTEKLFLPDRFHQSSKDDNHINCMYKTGDFGKFLTDGNLVYLGRIDQQVKIRGYRIEMSEIEDVLYQHSNVDEVVLAACLNPNGDKCLVAYIKSIDGCTIPIQSLSDHIKAYLPEYMVPSLIIFLNHIPRNPNGKIDRSALPSPNWHDFYIDIPSNDSTTELQKEIITIWQSVLGHTKIGLHDNFFTVGGHSLLATRMLIKINEKFDIKLPIRSIFEHPKLIDFAANVERTWPKKVPKEAIISRASRENILEASSAQQRMWLLHQLYDKTSSYNMVAAFKMLGYLDGNLLKKVLIEIISRHEILRTTFVEIDGKLYQNISEFSDLSFSKESGDLGTIIQQEAHNHFNLKTGPLFRTKLVQLDAQSHILIFNMHHIIADGWSIGILIKEFSLLWNNFKANHPSPLQALSIQYADYSVWQNAQLESVAFQQQLQYWKSQLAGYSGNLTLPANKAITRSIASKAGHLAIEIDTEILSPFQHLLQREGATLFMGLTALLGIVTHLHSDSEDIIIGTVVANRNHSQLEALIGFFANTLALRLDLSEDIPFNQFLQQIKQTIILAYENQDFPFEKVIDDIQPVRTLNQHALFQTMLILQNTAFEEISLDGMQIEIIDVSLNEAKFDLLFNLSEMKGGLYGKLEFNADRYDSPTMENMLKHFIQLMNKININPEIPIKQILVTENKVPEFLEDHNVDNILAELIFGNEHMDSV